jgi:hypothetical protein
MTFEFTHQQESLILLTMIFLLFTFLLIIYFFWNGLLWIFSLVAYYFLGAFNAPGFIHDKIFGGLLSVFGLSEHYPINYQFWFLKDLLF